MGGLALDEPRVLTLDDVEAFLRHSAAAARESGRDGDVYSGPYGRDEPYDVEAMRERTRVRWSRTISEVEWRRAWGVFAGAEIVASATLTGGALAAELHRARLGMHVLRGHRRRGLGRRLLTTVVAWCRAEPALAWLDLGVFADNAPAIALYRAMGFTELGTTVDRYRVDDTTLDDIAMTLRVDQDPQ